MLITVSRIDIFRGTAAPVLVDADRCPCCGGAVREFELEWEVSGLPVAARTECTAPCGWAQGWNHSTEWVRTAG